MLLCIYVFSPVFPNAPETIVKVEKYHCLSAGILGRQEHALYPQFLALYDTT